MLVYTNRAGKTYYLKESVTKTGKPRYFFSQKKEGKGELVKHLPEGREIYERVEDGQVFLRKQQAKHFLEGETALIESLLATKLMSFRYLYQENGSYLTIYETGLTSALCNGDSDLLSHSMSPFKTAGGLAEKMVSKGNFTAVLRFYLNDPEKQQYTAERYCFLGSIDDWIFLDKSDSFKSLAEKYIGLLGTDEFYNFPFG